MLTSDRCTHSRGMGELHRGIRSMDKGLPSRFTSSRLDELPFACPGAALWVRASRGRESLCQVLEGGPAAGETRDLGIDLGESPLKQVFCVDTRAQPEVDRGSREVAV